MCQSIDIWRKVILEVKTDPEVPPLPPQLTFDQMRHLTPALMTGDPHESGVIAGAFRQLFSGLVSRT